MAQNGRGDLIRLANLVTGALPGRSRRSRFPTEWRWRSNSARRRNTASLPALAALSTASLNLRINWWAHSVPPKWLRSRTGQDPLVISLALSDAAASVSGCGASHASSRRARRWRCVERRVQPTSEFARLATLSIDDNRFDAPQFVAERQWAAPGGYRVSLGPTSGAQRQEPDLHYQREERRPNPCTGGSDDRCASRVSL
jgi:hypothetical protein